MYRNQYQSSYFPILYSVGTNPLAIWGKEVRNGHVRRVTDEDINSFVLELTGANVAVTYIYSPQNLKGSLAIKHPFFVMLVKDLKRYFTFEITILDDKNMRRRFRVSNYLSTTRVKNFICSMPLGLNPGWNQIQFNLRDFTRRAFGSNYVETVRVQIHANCRLRCVYFCDKLRPEEEVPEYCKLCPETRANRLATAPTGMTQKQRLSSEEAYEQVMSTQDVLAEDGRKSINDDKLMPAELTTVTITTEEKRELSEVPISVEKPYTTVKSTPKINKMNTSTEIKEQKSLFFVEANDVEKTVESGSEITETEESIAVGLSGIDNPVLLEVSDTEDQSESKRPLIKVPTIEDLLAKADLSDSEGGDLSELDVAELLGDYSSLEETESSGDENS